VHEPCEFANVFGFTVELVGERTLARSLKEDGTPGLELLQRYGEELLHAVQHLDEEGVFHRDIKPENIGISEAGSKNRKSLRLFDFSLAAVPPTEVRVGTLEYLDPFLEERNARRYDPSAGARSRWTKSPILVSLRDTVYEVLLARGGVMGHRELVAQVLASKPCAAGELERT
jgi:serine/threonine protein kinase